MPLYDFECKQCGNLEEKLVRMQNTKPFSFALPETITCSACGSENVQRLIGSPLFHLKGGGWAKDSYGSVPAAPKTAEEG